MKNKIAIKLLDSTCPNLISHSIFTQLRRYSILRFGAAVHSIVFTVFRSSFAISPSASSVICMPNSETAISWLWVIEALASFNEVSPSLLHDLLQVIPAYRDGLGPNANEIIALRCLEDLFSSPKGITGAHGHKVEFDISENCYNVLQRTLQETPLSNLRTNGADLSKWDVHSFITQKRASMPKCTLLQLKDAIVDGTCPHATLLRRYDGMSFKNGVDKIHVNDGSHHAFNLGPNGSCVDAQMRPECNADTLILGNRNTELEENNHDGNELSSQRCRADEATTDVAKGCHANHNNTNVRPNLTGSDVQSMGPEGNSDHFIPETRNTKLKENRNHGDALNSMVDRNETSVVEKLPCKRSRTELAYEDMPVDNENNKSTNDFSVLDANFKKLKICASSFQSMEHNPFSLHEELFGYLSTRNFPGFVNKVREFKENQNGTVDERTVCARCRQNDDNKPQVIHSEVNDSPDILLHDIVTNKSKCCSGHNFQFQVPNCSSPSRFMKKNNAGEIEKVVDCCRSKAVVSCDMDDYQNEKIDVGKKKHHFLTSECTVRHGSSTKQNLCMKCNKGGQLLMCSTSSCPLVVHEDCLGFSARSDDKGDHHCPFCAYSIAITEYLEAKKEASLVKKEVAIFICKDLVNREKEFTDRVDKKNQCRTRTKRVNNFIVKSPENECVGQKEDNREKQGE